jgi:hypothetical protein
MINVSVKIDPKSFEEFQKACEDFAKGLNTGTHYVAIAQAHHICMEAMEFTPPLAKGGGQGLKKPAETAGNMAVKLDIKSIAISADNRSAAFMMYRKLGEAAYRSDRGYFDRVLQNSKKILETTRNPIMRKIAMDPDHERAFKKAKNLFARAVPQTTSDGLHDKFYDDIREPHKKALIRYNGRKIREKQKTGWLNKYITSNQSIIDNEVKRSQLFVGALKAGWFKAKQRIPKMLTRVVKKPGGNIPAWVSRHGQPNGVTKYSYTGKTLSLSVINLIGDNNGVATEARTKATVYGLRVKNMPKEMQYILDAQVAKFNKKQTKNNGN